MKEDQLTEVEKKLFAELSKESTPPGSLEDSIVRQLTLEGLITKKKTMNVYVKWAASIAASLLLFFGGMWVGRTTSSQIAIEPTNGYMLLLHEGPGFTSGDPMEMFAEYRAWMINTYNKGLKITGQELRNEATLVAKSGVLQVGEEVEERTTGYFLLEAESMEEALEVARANPHIKYGGTIEVKPYMVR